MNKYKIAWITPDYFYDVDWPIIEELKDYYEIRWYLIWDASSKREVPNNINAYKFIRLKHSIVDPRRARVYCDIINNINSFKPDIVYTGFEGFPYFMPILYSKVGAKHVILAGHEMNPWRRGSRSLPVRMYLKWHAKRVGYVQVFSKFAEKEFYRLYPGQKCSYVPMIPKDYGEVSEKLEYRGRKVFLFFGSIRPDKRLDVLLKAFTSMDIKYQQKALLLVYGGGNKELMAEAEQLCQGYNNIELHFGYVADRLIPTLFTSADYLVLPYQTVTQSGPNMIAYNYNLPIIASDIDGFTERITDDETGFLFHVNDVESLKNALEKIIDEKPEDYLRIKNNMYAWVKKEYSVDAVIEKYKAMIDNFIAEIK